MRISVIEVSDMPKTNLVSAFLGSLIFAAILAVPVHAADSPGVPVTVLVTVLGDKGAPPAAIPQTDVNVYSGKSKLDVTAWTPANSNRPDLQLAILINCAENTTLIGSELGELTDFIKSQPKTTSVGLFYAIGENIQTAAPFSTDRAAAAKALRATLGVRFANSPNIYISLNRLIEKWPTPGPRREVLLIASGFDPLYPDLEDPFVQAAMAKAQKEGILVHTLYAGGARLGESFDGDIAQNNLDQLSSQTGGAALYSGIVDPPSFEPYLRELNALLSNQYFLTFNIPPAKNGASQGIQVHVDEHMKILYPPRVFVSGP
jgi:hypothetical protein